LSMKVELKEKIKREIDSVPEEYLQDLEQYIGTIKSQKARGKRVKTLHLKGRFDDVNIRRIAHE